jgi:hypothetical protein
VFGDRISYRPPKYLCNVNFTSNPVIDISIKDSRDLLYPLGPIARFDMSLSLIGPMTDDDDYTSVVNR